MNDSVEFRLVSAKDMWEAEDKIRKAFESPAKSIIVEDVEVLETIE